MNDLFLEAQGRVMQSSNPKKLTINLVNVSKEYALYGSPFKQMLGYLGVGLKNVRKQRAIDTVNLKISQGEKVGIVGHNGSGKTTLLRLIAGFTEPSAGKIFATGSIQSLMQRGYGFNDALSGIENIRNAMVYNGLPHDEMTAAEADIINFVELGEFIHHPVKTYSLGMRARLEFAAATAIHPDVLVIDEVLGAGDGYFVKKCAARMRQLVENTTLLLVSHSLDQIREYCDRVIWMDGGRLREDGSVDQVLGNYRRYMNDRSAKALKGDMVNLEKGLTINAERQSALQKKLKVMFGASTFGWRINEFAFLDEIGNVQVLETGDPLALRLDITLDRPMCPVVLGLTEHGGFVFEMMVSAELSAGRHVLTLRSPRLEVGVGTYILVPALLQPGLEGYSVNSTFQLELQMAVTNWSDPPLVHLNAEWYSGANRQSIQSKVNAWV